MFYITFIFNVDMLRAWPLLTFQLALLDSLSLCVLDIYMVYCFELIRLYYHYHPTDVSRTCR